MTNKMATSGKNKLAQRELQHVLLRTLAEAKVRNNSYSLRAFARKLRISPAALSEILNNKRKVSSKLAIKLLKLAEADPLTTKRILDDFNQSSINSTSENAESAARYTELSNDQFKTVADWYHFGILSLLETTNARSESAWIASRLGLRSSEVIVAMERLERLGMIAKGKDGEYALTGKQFHTTDDIASSAIRTAHAQSLQLAQTSLETDEHSLRDFTSLTIAINPAKLAHAKKMIRKFRTKLAEELEVDPKQEVYMLCVHLFPLSRKSTEKN